MAGLRGQTSRHLETVDLVAVRRARQIASEFTPTGFPVEAMDAQVRPAVPLGPEVIDHCVLSQTASEAEIEAGARIASDAEFRSMCVNPHWVRRTSDLLEGSATAVTAMVAFPGGQSRTQTKQREAALAVSEGATAIDMVANLSMLKDGNYADYVDDIRKVMTAVHPFPVIVIIEAGLLRDSYEQALAAALASFAGAAVVKSSSGFAPSHRPGATTLLGATAREIEVIARSAAPWTGIKAAGGIRTRDHALAMLAAGATRIGTSHGPAILRPGDGPSRDLVSSGSPGR